MYLPPSLKRFNELNLTEFYKNLNSETEVCGVWDKHGEIFLYPNLASQPEKQFTFSSKVWAKLKSREYVGIIHSHLKNHPTFLSSQDINIADTLACDVACYHVESKIWDFFSPLVPHSYPLSNDDWAGFNSLKSIKYEAYRCDCYRFIEYCFLCIGYRLPTIPRDTSYYSQLPIEQKLKSSGWQVKNGDILRTSDMVVMNINGLNHFALIIGQNGLTFTSGGIKSLSFRTINKYTTATFELKNKPTNLKQLVGLYSFYK